MEKFLNDADLEHWQTMHAELRADAEAVAYYKERDKRRITARKEMLELLGQYLADQLNTEFFRLTFDNKTRTDWKSFGFKGMSGGMFLNKLVKHTPDVQALAAQLHSSLAMPITVQDGQQKMQQFLDFLNEWVESGATKKVEIQPSRTPFFLSAWWHLQDTEKWPVFYGSGRVVLEQEGLYQPTGEPCQDYFTFREVFLALAAALGLRVWDMEHLLHWRDKQGQNEINGEEEEPTPPEAKINSREPELEQSETSHTQIQCLLAQIGKKLGCKVWIAANDQTKSWKGTRLGDLSIKQLPSLGMDEESLKYIRLIDVLWLKGTNQVAAAFEVEHTTSVYSGLLRMSDLVALSPNLNFPLYIVIPQDRIEKVQHELSRPTFQTLGLHHRCGFFSNEKLVREAESILKWATSPDVIKKLASKVEDVGGEEEAE